jgi:hypothetical protein
MKALWGLVFSTALSIGLTVVFGAPAAGKEPEWNCSDGGGLEWCSIFVVANLEHVGGGARTASAYSYWVGADVWITGANIDDDGDDWDEAEGFVGVEAHPPTSEDMNLCGVYTLHSDHWYYDPEYGYQELQLNRTWQEEVVPYCQ